MKHFSTNFSVLALICALCVGITACNDSLETENGEWGREIRPVSMEQRSELSAFFEDYLRLLGISLFFDYNDWPGELIDRPGEFIHSVADAESIPLDGYFGGGNYIDSCIMINSVDEYYRLIGDNYTWGAVPELPVIDFDSHTLVICQYEITEPIYQLAKYRLAIKEGVATMSLELKRTPPPPPGFAETHMVTYLNYYFWDIYPKIDAESIHTIVSRP